MAGLLDVAQWRRPMETPTTDVVDAGFSSNLSSWNFRADDGCVEEHSLLSIDSTIRPVDSEWPPDYAATKPTMIW